MKKTVRILVGVLGLGISIAQSQTLLNSWEDSLEGWSIANTNDFTSNGFSTNNGVTDGLYSWEVENTTGGYIWDQVGDAPDLQGPYSTELTAQLGNATSVTLDMYLPASDFDWGIGFSLYLDQPGGAGPMIISQWENWSGLGETNTYTFAVPQSVRTAMLENPGLPSSLRLATGGGAAGTMYLDNLIINLVSPTSGKLWARELFDGLGSDQIPANVSVTNLSSTVGLSADAPWVVNPDETENSELMAFRTLSTDEPVVGSLTMGLPTTLDGTFGCLVQENSGFSFFPGEEGSTFWTDGDFMTRLLEPEGYINFQAEGEYWFSMTLANKPWDDSSQSGSLFSQYVVFPSSGWGGLGFANGGTTNAEYVAIGVTGLDVYYGPTNASYPWGETNASKALYISQGTLGQSGNVDTLLSANTNLYTGGIYTDEAYSHTNFSGGPYHINALADQTVGILSGDYIVLLGRLKTFGDGTATVDAKYYGTGLGGNSWNTELDTDPNSITWDASYSFNFDGTMTRMLLFQNGQFPFYIYGFRTSTKFSDVVGLDRGYITVSPLTDTYVGYSINMTNLAVQANEYSWAVPPAGYGPLNHQWYQDGTAISGATSQAYNIASASLSDAGIYTCVATDLSGTWGSVTNSVAITITELGAPNVTSVEMFHDGNSVLVTYDQPNLTGADEMTHYVFDNGIMVTNLVVTNTATGTEAFLTTTPTPLGTKVSLTISGVTNVVGDTLATTVETFWTDLVQTGVANWDAWLYPAGSSENDYFNNFVPANPNPPILQSMSLATWEGPTDGITIVGNNGFVGDGYGSKVYGWFVPPVTTNYVFYAACDDGGRLSLSTDDSPENLRVIACESLWSGENQWTNICDQFPGPLSPHRGDGTATGVVGSNSDYVWDNSVAGQSPATACLQNRSDQFIVAFYGSSGLPGGPPQASNDNWLTAVSQVTDCVPIAMTNDFWPNVDANGQALITLQAGEMYYMELEHVEIGGGQNESVTYKFAGDPDPDSGIPGDTDPTASALTSSVIAGTAPFMPTISIAQDGSGPVITYTGVLLAGTELSGVTNVVAQSSASTAISLGGPSQYTPPGTSTSVFYRTSE